MDIVLVVHHLVSADRPEASEAHLRAVSLLKEVLAAEAVEVAVSAAEAVEAAVSAAEAMVAVDLVQAAAVAIHPVGPAHQQHWVNSTHQMAAINTKLTPVFTPEFNHPICIPLPTMLSHES